MIRAGLRRISLAYSRISLADVASKLGLANVEDTECIVAKAIRSVQMCLWPLFQPLLLKRLESKPDDLAWRSSHKF